MCFRYSYKDPLLQEFLKMINEDLKLNCIHARYSKKGNAWLYLTFPTETEQASALQLLKKYNWKGRSLISTVRASIFFFNYGLLNQFLFLSFTEKNVYAITVCHGRHTKNKCYC